jgi:hypothetical protein
MNFKSVPTAVFLVFFSVIFAGASKHNPFASVQPRDRALLEPAIKRFAQDEMKLNWSDLWEIDEQDVATKREFSLKDDAPLVDRQDYIEYKQDALASGGVPVMTSFDLTSVVPDGDGFTVSGCSSAKRESFHFKGIIEVEAHIRQGKVTFGSWRFKYLMPHSCSQKEDSPS